MTIYIADTGTYHRQETSTRKKEIFLPICHLSHLYTSIFSKNFPEKSLVLRLITNTEASYDSSCVTGSLYWAAYNHVIANEKLFYHLFCAFSQICRDNCSATGSSCHPRQVGVPKDSPPWLLPVCLLPSILFAVRSMLFFAKSLFLPLGPRAIWRENELQKFHRGKKILSNVLMFSKWRLCQYICL
jgi:hypothetical protein